MAEVQDITIVAGAPTAGDGTVPTLARTNAMLAAVAVKDSAGNVISPDSWPQTLTYNTDGTVNTVSFTDTVNTWTQTFTYTSGRLTGISKWVKA